MCKALPDTPYLTCCGLCFDSSRKGQKEGQIPEDEAEGGQEGGEEEEGRQSDTIYRFVPKMFQINQSKGVPSKASSLLWHLSRDTLVI